MTHRRAERRRHVRRPAADLEWLRGARLRPGLDAALSDISPGGARVETAARLRPGVKTALHLKTRNDERRASGEVVRAWVSAIRPDGGVVYGGAVRFDRPIDLPGTG